MKKIIKYEDNDNQRFASRGVLTPAVRNAHKTIKLVGCLDCNRTWMQDYGE